MCFRQKPSSVSQQGPMKNQMSGQREVTESPPAQGSPLGHSPKVCRGRGINAGPGVPLTPRSRHLFVQHDIARGAELLELPRGKQPPKE